ncbi:MAG: hypothetical protein ACTSPQ_12940 [Candidatus Helarchaeota archaeon]
MEKLKDWLRNIQDFFTKLNEKIDNEHKKYFIIIFIVGLVVRIVSLWGFLAFGTGDWNDMNEKVWIALNTYLINGINPYGQIYKMPILDITNIENFYQYPPLSFIIHAPALLWPGPASYFEVDFMPVFFIIHFIIDFYMFYRLWKVKFNGSAITLWLLAGPLMVLFDFITFISVPMFFILLAYLNMDKPKRSAFYISCGVSVYTYLGIPALFLLTYFIKKQRWNGIKNFIIGAIPAILTILPFLIWDPKAFLSDIFMSQGTRVSGNFIHPTYGDSYWWTHLFSIPPYINTIYNLLVDPSIPLSLPYLTPILLGIVILFVLYFLIKLYLKPSVDRLIDYSFWTILIFILIAPSGFLGYMFLPFILLSIKINKNLLKNK